MKVLIVTNIYPTAARPFVSPFVKEQVESMRERYPEMVIDVRVIEGLRPRGKYLREMLSLPFYVKSGGYDIVHAHFGLTLISTFFVRVPVVVTFHGSDLLVKPTKYISRLLAPMTSKVIVVAEKLKESLGYGEVIPCGIATENFALPAEYACKPSPQIPGKLKVLFPSDPSRKIKNYELFQATCRELERRGNVIEEVHLAHFNRADIPEVFWHCDLMILTSFSEGSPTVIKEAIAAKLPFVSVNVGDVKEWTTSVDFGVVVADDNPVTIADAATSLLVRFEQRSALDNSKCIEAMDIKNATKRVRAIYDDILEKRFPGVVMVCTEARGGIRSVIEQYRADGLFSRWNVLLLSSHKEGPFMLRLGIGIKAVLHFVLLLLKRRPLVVHCHAAMKNSFWRKSFIAMISKFAGVPVVFHLHGSEMKKFVNEQPRWLQAVIGRILARQSVVVVLSESWARYIKSVAPLAHVEILPNYVQMPVLGSDSNAGRNEGTINVLFLGVVGARKGVYDLLPAFKDALDQNQSLRLIIGGNGEIDQAKALAVELEINDYVTFPGWVNGETKIDLLRRASIFVLPSHNENFPVSLLEAMSWQVPVISSRAGGITDMVRDGVDGILIDAGDRAALTSAIVDLARNTGLRRKMGISARERVEQNFSKAVVLPKLEGIYNFLCDTTTRSRHIQGLGG